MRRNRNISNWILNRVDPHEWLIFVIHKISNWYFFQFPLWIPPLPLLLYLPFLRYIPTHYDRTGCQNQRTSHDVIDDLEAEYSTNSYNLHRSLALILVECTYAFFLRSVTILIYVRFERQEMKIFYSTETPTFCGPTAYSKWSRCLNIWRGWISTESKYFGIPSKSASFHRCVFYSIEFFQ